MIDELVWSGVLETVTVIDCLLEAESVAVTVTVRDGFSDLEAVLVIVVVILIGWGRVGETDDVVVLETLMERVVVTEPVDVLVDRIERVTVIVWTIVPVN
jgi:hypothetical protein